MAEDTGGIKDEVGKADKSSLSIEEARDVLGRLVLRAGYGNEQIELTYHGEPCAALVGKRDLERLRALDEQPAPASAA